VVREAGLELLEDKQFQVGEQFPRKNLDWDLYIQLLSYPGT
jgi:hypothetical protein